MVTIKNLECDAVFRKHQSRKTSTYQGKIIGESDKLVVWRKPQKCPTGLSNEEFAALPLTLTVREIHYYISISGFRTEQGAFNYYFVGHKNLSQFEARRALWLNGGK